MPLLPKLFNFLKKNPDINSGAEKARETGALLLDVRTPREFQGGHIPGSINLPLHLLEEITAKYPDKNQPIYVYCRSGNRSNQAKIRLLEMGYTTVYDLGGIHKYHGDLKK